MKALKCKASAPASGGPLAHAHGLEVIRYITCPSDKCTCTSHATKLKRRVSVGSLVKTCWCDFCLQKASRVLMVSNIS